MALYDHRVFRSGDKWWVAQVHGGIGATWGPETPKFDRESVIFTCLTDRALASCSANIPAGALNRLTHGSIRRLLESASPWSSRFDMSPYNTPDEEELGAPSLVDDEGLSWVTRSTQVVRAGDGPPQLQPAIEFICLDDSALRKTVLLKDQETLDAFLSTYGEDGLRAVVQSVKGTFDDLAPEGQPRAC